MKVRSLDELDAAFQLARKQTEALTVPEDGLSWPTPGGSPSSR